MNPVHFARATTAGVTLLVTNAIGGQVPAELSVRVTERLTGRPVAEADVEIVGRAERARSAGDGVAVLRGLEPGMYRLSIRALGFAPEVRDVGISNGRRASVDAVLSPLTPALDRVVVTGTMDASAVLGGTTFDRDAIVRSGSRDVGELVERAPSVVVTRSGSPGAPARVSIRGSSSSEVLILVDGVPINAAVSGSVDLSRLSVDAVERVTVLPGAQSARYGSRALAGVILIETRRPRREVVVSGKTGAWGERAASTVVGDAASAEDVLLSGSLAAEARATAGDFDYDVPAVRGGGRARRVNSDATSRNVLGTADLSGGRTVARARVDWEWTDRGVAGTIVQPSLTGRSNESQLSVGGDARTSFDRLVLSVGVDAGDERAHVADPAPPFGGRYDDRISARTSGARAGATWSATSGSIAVGSELRQMTVEASSLIRPSDAQRSEGFWIAGRSAFALGDATVTGDAGARLDWDSLLDGATSSPRATISVSRGIASLMVSTGNGFSPPSLGDRFFREGVLVRANPDLVPERVRGEVEVRAAVRDASLGIASIDAEIAAYRANIKGMIVWMPDFRFIWSPSNLDVHRSGWEARLRIAAARYGASLQGTATHTDVAYAGPVLSGQVAYRPRSTATIGAELDRLQSRLTLSTRFVGVRRTVPGSSLNLLDPYWLTDAMLALPAIGHTWKLTGTAGVTNLFARPAAMLVDYPFGGRAWTLGARLARDSWAR